MVRGSLEEIQYNQLLLTERVQSYIVPTHLKHMRILKMAVRNVYNHVHNSISQLSS